jgi:HEAT repeat protein
LSRKVLITICVIFVVLVGIWMATNYQRAKKTSELLIKLGDPDDMIALDAMDQLRHRGSAIGPRLLELAGSQQPRVCYRAVTLLSTVGFDSVAAREKLVALLSDKDTDVQRAAASACGHLNVAEAEGPLLRLIQDPKADPQLLALACQTIGMVGGKAAVPILSEIVKKHPPAEPKKPKVKELEPGEKPPPAPPPPAVPAPPKPKDKTWQLRVEADRALGAIGEAAGEDALDESIRDDQEPKIDVRVAAAYALGDLGSNPRGAASVEKACLALVKGLSDDAGDVRVASAMSLARLYPPSAVSPQVEQALKDHADDEHYWVREAVKYAARKLNITLNPAGA